MTTTRLTVAALAACLSGAAYADTLALHNGDRFSGRLESLLDDRLRFATTFGQKIEVPWDQVARVSTEESVRLMLADETWLAGRLAVAEDGRAELLDSDSHDPVSFDLAAVHAINPPEGPGVVPVETQGRLNFGASKTSGNTSTTSLHGDAEFLARTTRNRYTLGGEAHYAKDQGVRSKNEALGYARYDHFVDERWYLNSNVALARDEFKDLSLRTSFGIGVGYQFFDTDRSRLSLESGINYIHESFRDDSSESRPAGRLAFNYEHRLRGDALSLFHRNEALLGLDDIDDLLLRTRSGIRFPLLQGLNGTVQLNYDYDNQPPAGNERSDLAYLLTVGYLW